MSEGVPKGGGLARPILFALAAFFMASALVPAISASIEALSNGALTRPESTRHTGCTLKESLGGWLRLSCDAGPVNGALIHLVLLARHSDAVMTQFLVAANRDTLRVGIELSAVKAKVLKVLHLIDGIDGD